MNTELFKRYASVTRKLEEIEAEKQALREEIVHELRKSKIDKAETDYGSFTIGRRLSWAYSEAVKKIEERLKIAKTKEQQKGVAKSSETEYLVFTEPKKLA